MDDALENVNAAGDALDVLGVTCPISEGDLRRRYLELLKQHPPEKDPEGFKRIRAAYDALRRPAEQARLTLERIEQPPEALSQKAEEAGGPLGVSATWWLDADPWSDLTRFDFPEDQRDPL
jgi:DnaJ-class molecular chaperone